jgi:predicted membrane channel-forming protein YqfA (hemolysin III family)
MTTNETIVFLLALISGLLAILDLLRTDYSARWPLTTIGVLILSVGVAFWAWV